MMMMMMHPRVEEEEEEVSPRVDVFLRASLAGKIITRRGLSLALLQRHVRVVAATLEAVAAGARPPPGMAFIPAGPKKKKKQPEPATLRMDGHAMVCCDEQVLERVFAAEPWDRIMAFLERPVSPSAPPAELEAALAAGADRRTRLKRAIDPRPLRDDALVDVR